MPITENAIFSNLLILFNILRKGDFTSVRKANIFSTMMLCSSEKMWTPEFNDKD